MSKKTKRRRRSWKRRAAREERLMNSFSKWVMGGIMMTFFAGAGLGGYATIVLGEPVKITLDYIMRLALVVGLGYFVKAFGENIAKIILSFVFGAKAQSDVNDDNNGGI